MFDSLRRDLSLAVRNVVRRPGYAALAVLTLAVGIAGTTVVMSLVSGALLRPPPFHRSDRLVLVYRTASKDASEPRLTRWSFARFQALKANARAFQTVAAFGSAEMNLAGGGDPERVTGELVTADYLDLLGVGPVLGRTFGPEEDKTEGGHPLVVLGHRLWTTRFGGDRDVVGRSVRLNDEILTVIGVMPSGFRGLSGRADLWVTQTMAPLLTYRDYLTTDQNFISVVGRLNDGVAETAAAAELEVLGSRIAAEIPDTDDEADRWGATLMPLVDARVDAGNRQTLRLLLAAVGSFLLLACVNVAGLGLADVVARRREITVRLALGAGRGRVVRQLLTESAVIGVVAAGVGILAAAYLVRVVRLPTPRPGPGNMWGAVGDFAQATIDWRVLAASLLAALAAAAISGLIPAVNAGRTDLTLDLKQGGGAGGRTSRSRVHGALVVVEVALALALAVGGGLLFESLRRYQQTPLGIDPVNVLAFRIHPSDVRYPTDRAPALLDRVLDAVGEVPGVRAATVDACTPLGHCASSFLLLAGVDAAGQQGRPISRHYVGPDHFATLGIPVLAGRSFTDQDRAESPGVAVINETAARRFFPGQDPVGRRIWFGGGSRWTSPDSTLTIVGVVGDVPYGSLERAQVASVYTPYRQFSYAFRTVMVRVDGDPAQFIAPIRGAVASVDQLPIFEAGRLTDQLGGAWARATFVARLMAVFALVALALAAGGVYGIVSHTVNQRMRELGVRAALGASARALQRLVVGQGVRLALWGVGIGVLAALAGGRLIGSLLYGVRPSDPLVIGVLSGVLIATAAAASYLPARRAGRADPIRSLRSE